MNHIVNRLTAATCKLALELLASHGMLLLPYWRIAIPHRISKNKKPKFVFTCQLFYCQLRNMEGTAYNGGFCLEDVQKMKDFLEPGLWKATQNMVHHRKCERLIASISQGISKTVMYRGKLTNTLQPCKSSLILRGNM